MTVFLQGCWGSPPRRSTERRDWDSDRRLPSNRFFGYIWGPCEYCGSTGGLKWQLRLAAAGSEIIAATDAEAFSSAAPLIGSYEIRASNAPGYPKEELRKVCVTPNHVRYEADARLCRYLE